MYTAIIFMLALAVGWFVGALHIAFLAEAEKRKKKEKLNRPLTVYHYAKLNAMADIIKAHTDKLGRIDKFVINGENYEYYVSTGSRMNTEVGEAHFNKAKQEILTMGINAQSVTRVPYNEHDFGYLLALDDKDDIEKGIICYVVKGYLGQGQYKRIVFGEDG